MTARRARSGRPSRRSPTARRCARSRTGRRDAGAGPGPPPAPSRARATSIDIMRRKKSSGSSAVFIKTGAADFAPIMPSALADHALTSRDWRNRIIMISGCDGFGERLGIGNGGPLLDEVRPASRSRPCPSAPPSAWIAWHRDQEIVLGAGRELSQEHGAVGGLGERAGGSARRDASRMPASGSRVPATSSSRTDASPILPSASSAPGSNDRRLPGRLHSLLERRHDRHVALPAERARRRGADCRKRIAEHGEQGFANLVGLPLPERRDERHPVRLRLAQDPAPAWPARPAVRRHPTVARTTAGRAPGFHRRARATKTGQRRPEPSAIERAVDSFSGSLPLAAIQRHEAPADGLDDSRRPGGVVPVLPGDVEPVGHPGQLRDSGARSSGAAQRRGSPGPH